MKNLNSLSNPLKIIYSGQKKFIGLIGLLHTRVLLRILMFKENNMPV